MQTTEITTWVTMDCAECGVTMALTREYDAARRADRRTFYCPNGHSQWFPGKSDAKKAAEAEATAERLRVAKRAVEDQLAAANRSNAALRGVVTKTRKRIGNGVCPCCTRHFADVERHMANKHPGYGEG